MTCGIGQTALVPLKRSAVAVAVRPIDNIVFYARHYQPAGLGNPDSNINLFQGNDIIRCFQCIPPAFCFQKVLVGSRAVKKL